ncbi:PLC-like phosphodiesterase [Aspergillus campestris IBT 28561]|uniref:PLC-like phosphodiesterase n=1 Tax=Aspergillus campestris (strain IBT 28561) TaxID=1392248 RepID=A0A2I1CTC9_ASPC2|nr:PLC-like phosphodiesterase [Aspergillus campestris IBT 28561]PKY00878.1 PLC-like phosphodiesterase [Aspergillus campestris IBT 28561]
MKWPLALALALAPALALLLPLVAALDDITIDGTITATHADHEVPTADHPSYSSTKTLSHDEANKSAPTVVDPVSPNPDNASTVTSVSDSHTKLLTNVTANSTRTPTPSPSPSPIINTQPCNGHPEFCARKYSNVSIVAAHNSPFVKPGNVAANQALDVESQLDDGIRMLQFQTHLVNNTVYLCHTNCDIFNVGPLETYLTRVAQWVRTHPYDIVTIMIGNPDYIPPGKFVDPVKRSGLMDLVFTPSKIPMTREDWPTLSGIIFSGKRVVVFMDYEANQTAYPWLIEEFAHVWETPFSPTDPTFPCTLQRPPGLSPPDMDARLYMANHNLNLNVNLASLNLLIPNTASLVETNAVDGPSSLGLMANQCTTQWHYPPNFLLVDYYNYGKPNGSVFEVAARLNNVTYEGHCCGKTSSASGIQPGCLHYLVGFLLFALF